jgi:hypothetical protein
LRYHAARSGEILTPQNCKAVNVQQRVNTRARQPYNANRQSMDFSVHDHPHSGQMAYPFGGVQGILKQLPHGCVEAFTWLQNSLRLPPHVRSLQLLCSCWPLQRCVHKDRRHRLVNCTHVIEASYIFVFSEKLRRALLR